MSNLIGTVLLNQFRIDSFIASGGMGGVYKVWDLKRNVPLAMKVLEPYLTGDPSLFKRFQREANALRKLAHPNIIPFYGFYRDRGVTFLLESYVDGPTLKDVLRLKQGQPLQVKEALFYLNALCAALGYTHANGIVHSDVKPGNVIIDQGGNVYLTDFGIARVVEGSSTILAASGTPAYMAPEQIRGEVVSPATDIYALGVILFEMLTGQRPFKGTESGTENGGVTQGERIRYAHLKLLPPDPRSLNPSLPDKLSQVVLKALSKQPQERYKNTRDLIIAACGGAGLTPDSISNRQSPEYLFDSINMPNPRVVPEEYIPPTEQARPLTSEEESTQIPEEMKMDTSPIAEAAWLIIIEGPDKGKKLDISKRTTTIGRSLQCDIRIDNVSVSRIHCQIKYTNGRFILIDLGSSLGTKLNNLSIKATPLTDGDIIQLGDKSVLLFRPSEHQIKLSELWDELSSGLN